MPSQRILNLTDSQVLVVRRYYIEMIQDSEGCSRCGAGDSGSGGGSGGRGRGGGGDEISGRSTEDPPSLADAISSCMAAAIPSMAEVEAWAPVFVSGPRRDWLVRVSLATRPKPCSVLVLPLGGS